MEVTFLSVYFHLSWDVTIKLKMQLFFILNMFIISFFRALYNKTGSWSNWRHHQWHKILVATCRINVNNKIITCLCSCSVDHAYFKRNGHWYGLLQDIQHTRNFKYSYKSSKKFFTGYLAKYAAVGSVTVFSHNLLPETSDKL